MRPVIVGGGPGGAAAAIALARGGARPLLLERDAVVTEKVCGEFLAADAAQRLGSLGLDMAALGAVPIHRAIFAAGPSQAEMRLPFPAWGLPRATLDATLLDMARTAGAEVMLGTSVRGAAQHGNLWQVRLAGGETIETPNLILATGKHELRGLQRSAKGGAIGVKLPLTGDVPGGAILLLICAGGYAGLQPRPGGGANLCAALDPHAPGVAEAARSAHAFIAHVARGSALAAHVLSGLTPSIPRPLTIGGVPYGHVERGGNSFRVGDQASVIPSFCGDGVAMALASGEAAGQAVLGGAMPYTYQNEWALRVRGGMRLARLVSVLTARIPRMLVASVALAPTVAGWTARRTRLG